MEKKQKEESQCWSACRKNDYFLFNPLNRNIFKTEEQFFLASNKFNQKSILFKNDRFLIKRLSLKRKRLFQFFYFLLFLVDLTKIRNAIVRKSLSQQMYHCRERKKGRKKTIVVLCRQVLKGLHLYRKRLKKKCHTLQCSY